MKVHYCAGYENVYDMLQCDGEIKNGDLIDLGKDGIGVMAEARPTQLFGDCPTFYRFKKVPKKGSEYWESRALAERIWTARWIQRKKYVPAMSWRLLAFIESYRAWFDDSDPENDPSFDDVYLGPQWASDRMVETLTIAMQLSYDAVQRSFDIK